ncbi:MAG: hypothetical protein K2X47_17635, partial [Bdellovibrionales bacterium]|nr:hypothetical protein [Bdellovibrionales bacterium]
MGTLALLFLSSCGFILDQSEGKNSPSQSFNLETLWDSTKTVYISSPNLLLSWQPASGTNITYKVEVFETGACGGSPVTAKTQEGTEYLLSSLVDGNTYSIRLTAFNSATKSNSVCSSAIAVDMQNPTVSFSVTPPAVDLSTTGSFSFSGVDVGLSGIDKLECKIDSGAFETCTSPKSYASLALGPHVFSVKATDKAGNVSSISHAWMISNISAFQISGIRAATADTLADIWLVTNQSPRVDWTDATNEAEYEVGIYANDGTTIVCALVTVPANTTNTTFSGCNLTNLTNYKIRVTAKNGSQQVSASNSLFSVGVNFGATLDASLVAAYGFEENTGALVGDISGNNNHGVLNGGSWTGSGKYGNAISLSGSHPSRVDIPDSNSLDLSGQATLMAWFKPTGVVPDWKTLIMKENTAGDNYVYTLYPRNGSGTNAYAGIWVGGTEYSSIGGPIPTANTWQHLAMTYDGSNIRIYSNGTLGNSTAQTGNIDTSTGPLRIGGNSVWTTESFNGLVDEVRIYNRALSQTEIVNAMSEAVALVPANGSGPGNFKINGILGGQDNLADQTFLDTSASPTLQWTSALGGSSYRATLFEDDGTTIKCAEQTSTTVNVTFPGCLLSPATYYRASVTAVGSDSSTTIASNSGFRIYTGLLVLPVYPLYGAHWMDSIYNDGASATEASGLPCSGSEVKYSSCVHGGEMKKVATQFSSCSGLSLSDALGVFKWICRLQSGNAVFFTTGFNSGKGLKDLLNPTSWKTNSVSLSGAATGSSVTSTWWSNPVIAAPPNANPADAPIDLNQPTYAAGTIFTVASTTASGGYVLNGTKLALVTLGSSVLKYNGNATTNCNGGNRCLLVGSGPLVWLEGIFDGARAGGTNDADFIVYGGWGAARIHNSVMRNSANAGVYLGWPSSALRMTDVLITKNGF